MGGRTLQSMTSVAGVRGPVHHRVRGGGDMAGTPFESHWSLCPGGAAPAPAQVYPQSNTPPPHIMVSKLSPTR